MGSMGRATGGPIGKERAIIGDRPRSRIKRGLIWILADNSTSGIINIQDESLESIIMGS